MKLWNYIFILTGISVLMALGGADIAGVSGLLAKIGVTTSSTGIENIAIKSSFWDNIFSTTGILILATSTSLISLGLYVTTKDKALFILPVITTVFVTWISVLNSMAEYLKDYAVFGVIGAIILIPLTIGFIVSCIDYFMGVD